MSSSTPITVLMPVYNGERHVSYAIDSILKQSFSDFRLLIIDDGSTDRTLKIVRSYGDRRIDVVCNDSNMGLIATLNHGFNIASGEYVARMDSDDVSHPERLEKQYEFLSMNRDIGVLGTAIQVINSAGKAGCRYRFPAEHESIRWLLGFYCPLVHPSVMVRREVVVRAGGYRKGMRHVEDYDLWWRLSSETRFANLPNVLLYLRKHDGSITRTEATEHDQNALLVAKAAIGELVGEDVDEKVVECIRLRRCHNSETAIAAATTVARMYERCADAGHRDSDIGRYIRREAGLRTFLIGLKSSCNRRILMMAMRLDSWVVISVAKKGLRSVLCRLRTMLVDLSRDRA